MNIGLSTGQALGVGMTVLQVSRDGRSLFVSNPYPELGGRWYGPDGSVGPRSIVIDKGEFSTKPWRFSQGMNLRFDEFRLRPVNQFGLSAGKTYVLFFDADNYPRVVRLRPTEVNQLQAYRTLLLAGVEDVMCYETLQGLLLVNYHCEISVTDGELANAVDDQDREVPFRVKHGTFVVIGVRTDGGIQWTHAHITPNCDVQALTLSLTRVAPEPATTTA